MSRKANGEHEASASADDGWAALTWDDVTRWAGSRSVTRGRAYHRGGHVADLRKAADGRLLATVRGGDDYATTVSLAAGKGGPALASDCSCPVGISCKHAVAVVAEYLDAVAAGRAVPTAAEDDPRWELLETAADGDDGEDEEWDDDESDDEDDANFDDEDEDEEDNRAPARGARKAPAAKPKADGPEDWDQRIQQDIRAKSPGELADLVWSLVRRFPELHREFRERLALQSGDVRRLVAEARKDIAKVTRDAGWSNHWDAGGHLPDYAPVTRRFERLLELGHADEVVALGREFIREGLRQIGESNDEGETSTAFAEALPVVFQAVLKSRLSAADRLLFAIDAVFDDEYDVTGEASAAVFDAPATPEDWSAVADVLAARLQALPARADDFVSDYDRGRLAGWVGDALEKAGRDAEVLALYEAEARAGGGYQRLVAYLLEEGRVEDAERWAREGIAATVVKYPGIAADLAGKLRELAEKRKEWDVVAAHVANEFFEHPSAHGFRELVKAAAKATVEEPVRAAALRFLETGVSPVQIVAPRAAPLVKSPGRKKAAAARPVPAPAPPKVTVDPRWPLPVPDYLAPLWGPRRQFDTAPRPHLDVLLEVAIAAKRPDDVLAWFDKMRAAPTPQYHRGAAEAYADRVAEAVAATHPDRALDTYQAALTAQLPDASPTAYQAATGYLRKLRPLYKALARPAEWDALVSSIREKYKNRPRFMELLDTLDGRTIVQTARGRRRQ